MCIVDGPQPEKRIGDRERREVDAHLQMALADGVLTLTEYDERAAQCWAARTRSDLDVLTADLPSPAEPLPVENEGAATTPARSGDQTGSGVTERIVSGVVTAAVVAAGLYAGVQVLGADDGVSVFSSRVLQVGDDQERVEFGTLFGSVRIVVPDDVRVRTTGTIIFGSVACDQACEGGSGEREVVVDTRGGFGSIEVLTQGEAARGDDQDDS
ncbi:MAG: DUF1707 domain-containing protein [Pseudonocardiaceae bacterium]|nr:DUF1707 domain-containing protein [Pseudonocardiaceae bacterium]